MDFERRQPERLVAVEDVVDRRHEVELMPKGQLHANEIENHRGQRRHRLGFDTEDLDCQTSVSADTRADALTAVFIPGVPTHPPIPSEPRRA